MSFQPNYSLDGIEDRAKIALADLHEHVAYKEEEYRQRSRSRLFHKRPTLAIVGMGRSGKDTAGEFLDKQFLKQGIRSSSLTVLPFVAHMVGAEDARVYQERHDHRLFWIAACHALRKNDPTRLARWCLADGDIAIGLRGKEEFLQVMQQRVCTLSVWIERDVPVDPTVEFSRDDCDVVIENTTTIERFHEKLLRFGKIVYRA